MTVEEEVFQKSKIVFQTLEKNGFVFDGETYGKSVRLTDDLTMCITVKKDGTVTAKVIDTTFDNEEYTAFRVEEAVGPFVGEIRKKFREELEKVEKSCCVRRSFPCPQADRITNAIFEKYGEHAIYKWEDDDTVVFERADNKKWYGIIMFVSRSKVGGGEGFVNVMNVKLPPEEVEFLKTRKGYAPAYHMTKVHWISMLLDDSLSDDEILLNVETSRQAVKKR